MNELFGKFNRPKAELKHIEKIINVFSNAKEAYKSKNYNQALELLNETYKLLLEVWDIYPKILTLYLIMKCNFNLKQYNDCELVKENLEKILHSIYKDRRQEYFKMKSKMFLYDLIVKFINDDLNESIESIINAINYISDEDNMILEEKISFFWRYIKGFLKLIGKDKTTKFELFKSDYDNMLFMAVKISKDEFEKVIPTQKIKKSMLEEYKTFFNFKLRQSIYEYLDNEFYSVKYGKSDDKLMLFLQKNMETFVRDNNKNKLISDLKIYLILNKINTEKEFGLNYLEIIHEQKRRIDAFDAIYSNLIGAFNHIFKEYLEDNEGDTSNLNYKPKNEKQQSDWKKLLNQMNNRNLLENMKNKELKKLEENKNSTKIDFKKEIIIPENDEEMDKIIINNIKSKYKINNRSKFNQSNIKSQIIKSNNNYNFSNINKNNYNKHNNSMNLFFQTSNTKLIPKIKLEKKHKKYKINDFIYRNINNFLINKIISIFTPIFKIQNGIQKDPITEIEYVPILPKKTDIMNLNYPNLVKSYFALSNKGTRVAENQDCFFYYDNFLLIKNCILFGVCDGHGKNGGKISNLISALYPSYIFYLILDDNCIRRKQHTNELILKLFKIQETPEHSKKIHFLRYIMNKLGVENSYIPFVTGNETSIFNLLYESVHLCHKALSEKYKIDIDYSGTTLCSGLIIGRKLYISNIGDSTAILGVFNNKGNTWSVKMLSNNHTPDLPEENKRINQNNGKVERLKNELGEEFGPYRVFEKDSDNSPGLAMSRSIGDEKCKKLGVIYEPELSVYNLGSEHRIIIIGSDGLWNYVGYEEAIQIAGKVYDEGRKVDEVVRNLMEIARQLFIENKKKIRKEKKKQNVNNKSVNSGMVSDRKSSTNDDASNDLYMMTKYESKSIDDITCLVIFLRD